MAHTYTAESPTSTLTSPSRRRQARRARRCLAIAPPRRAGSGRLRLSDAVAVAVAVAVGERVATPLPLPSRPTPSLRERVRAALLLAAAGDALGFGGGRWQRVSDGSQIALEAEARRRDLEQLRLSADSMPAFPLSGSAVLHIATAQAIVAVGLPQRVICSADDALFNADRDGGTQKMTSASASASASQSASTMASAAATAAAAGDTPQCASLLLPTPHNSPVELAASFRALCRRIADEYVRCHDEAAARGALADGASNAYLEGSPFSTGIPPTRMRGDGFPSLPTDHPACVTLQDAAPRLGRCGPDRGLPLACTAGRLTRGRAGQPRRRGLHATSASTSCSRGHRGWLVAAGIDPRITHNHPVSYLGAVAGRHGRVRYARRTSVRVGTKIVEELLPRAETYVLGTGATEWPSNASEASPFSRRWKPSAERGIWRCGGPAVIPYARPGRARCGVPGERPRQRVAAFEMGRALLPHASS